MKYSIRQLFMQSQSLYRLYFRLRLKNNTNLRLPRSGDDLYIDGYPRSGNTYLAGLINFFYPKIQISTHLHTPAALKIALGQDIPSLVLLRNPEQAIASNLHRRRHMGGADITNGLIDTLIADYVRYYQFALSELSAIQVVLFSRLRDDPLSIIRVATIEELNAVAERPAVAESIACFEQIMQTREAQKRAGATSLPSKSDIVEKSDLSDRVRARSCFAEASDVYRLLQETDIKQADF